MLVDSLLLCPISHVVLEKLYQIYQGRISKTPSNISIVSSPSNLLQIIRFYPPSSFLIPTRYLEIQLKHRLLTAGNSPEDSPLDSLILTQYERIEEQTSGSHLDKKCPEAMDDQCQNEDMIHGGYGLEESKEGTCLL